MGLAIMEPRRLTSHLLDIYNIMHIMVLPIRDVQIVVVSN